MTKPILLFDFGGVLVDLDRERVLESFLSIGIDIRPYLGDYKQSGVFSKLEEGSVTIPEFCDELRALCHAPQASNEDIVAAWETFLHKGVPTDRLELLLKIKKHYSVNLLSNTNEVHWRMAEEDFFHYKGLHADDFFDRIFLSCRLGVEKPAPLIFEKVAEGLGAAPADILFFDDSEVNCQAARDCGLQALLAPANSEWFKYFDEDGKLRLS